MALGKGPSALQRPLPSPGYRIRHLGDQAACKEGESSESASVQVRDAGVGRMLGCEPCSLSVQFIPVSSAGSWRASMLGPLSEERESRELNSKEDVSGSSCWQLEVCLRAGCCG